MFESNCLIWKRPCEISVTKKKASKNRIRLCAKNSNRDDSNEKGSNKKKTHWWRRLRQCEKWEWIWLKSNWFFFVHSWSEEGYFLFFHLVVKFIVWFELLKFFFFIWIKSLSAIWALSTNEWNKQTKIFSISSSFFIRKLRCRCSEFKRFHSD